MNKMCFRYKDRRKTNIFGSVSTSFRSRAFNSLGFYEGQTSKCPFQFRECFNTLSVSIQISRCWHLINNVYLQKHVITQRNPILAAYLPKQKTRCAELGFIMLT